MLYKIIKIGTDIRIGDVGQPIILLPLPMGILKLKNTPKILPSEALINLSINLDYGTLGPFFHFT